MKFRMGIQFHPPNNLLIWDMHIPYTRIGLVISKPYKIPVKKFVKFGMAHGNTPLEDARRSRVCGGKRSFLLPPHTLPRVHNRRTKQLCGAYTRWFLNAAMAANFLSPPNMGMPCLITSCAWLRFHGCGHTLRVKFDCYGCRCGA